VNELIKVDNVAAVTMTSLELVDFINNQRKEGEAVLAHSDFLKKVPVVLGGDAGKFSSIYLDSINRQKPCYRFPKREACLMAMSYSYELQAKVFDRMTELENRATAIRPTLPDFTNPAIAARAWADEVEAKQAALVQLEAAKPSVEFVQRDSEWGLMRESIRCPQDSTRGSTVNYSLFPTPFPWKTPYRAS